MNELQRAIVLMQNIDVILPALRSQLARLEVDKASPEFNSCPPYLVVRINDEIHKIKMLLGVFGSL